MDIEKQINDIERGKQIGYIIETDTSMSLCGIQKRKEQDYLVYISNHDFEFDEMDSGIKEYYSFSDLKRAINYIISRGFPFDEFAPQKGNKIFNINFFREDNTIFIK